MHHFEAKDGTHFNFNSDMSGDVHYNSLPGSPRGSIPGSDLLEFARWYAVEYAGMSSEPKPAAETVGTVEIRGPSEPTKLGEVLYQMLHEAAAWRAPGPIELEAGLRDLLSGFPEDTDAAAVDAESPTRRPTRRPARDVAHDILALGGGGRALSTVEAADAIVAIIRADRKGGQ